MTKLAHTEQDLLPAILSRWSPRAFDENKDIPAHLMKELLEAARWSPSCFNEQPWRFLLFGRDDQFRQEVESTLLEGNVWAKKASHLMVITAYKTFKHNNNDNRHHTYDVGAAVMSMILQAQHRQIVTHQMAGFKESELRSILEIPEDVNILVVMAVGYEDENKEEAGLSEKYLKMEKSPRQRLSREQIASIGTSWNFNKG